MTASAAKELASTSTAAMDDAKRKRQDERDHQRRVREIDAAAKRQSGDSGTDPAWGYMLIGIVALASILTAYLRYRQTITVVVSLFCTAALCFLLSALASLIARRVRVSGWLRVQLIINVILTIVALYATRWLSNPLLVTNRSEFERILLRTRTVSVGDMISGGVSSDVISGITYQIVGLIFLALSTFLIFCHTIITYTVCSVAVLEKVQPTYQPNKLRRAVMQLFGGPTRCWWAAFFVTIVSLCLIAGLGSRLASTNSVKTLSAKPNELLSGYSTMTNASLIPVGSWSTNAHNG